MYEILKMLFREIMIQRDGLESIKTISDLCDAVIIPKKIAEVFAIVNDNAELDTLEVLGIANVAYQEVCANAGCKDKNL